MDRLRIRHPGRAWAYGGSIFGGVLSLVANAASLALAPPGAPANWSPDPWAVGSSVFWPVLLFVGFEIMTRVVWTGQFRWARWLGMLPVVLVPGYVSYRHMSGLLARLGEDHVVSTLGPLAIDGLMLMAAMALMAQAQTTRALRDLRPAFGRG